MFLLCSAVPWVTLHRDNFSVLPAECGWRMRLALQAAQAEVNSPHSIPQPAPCSEHCGARALGPAGFSALHFPLVCYTGSLVWLCLEGLSQEHTMSQMVLRDKDPRSVSEGLHLSGKRLFAPPLNNKGIE